MQAFLEQGIVSVVIQISTIAYASYAIVIGFMGWRNIRKAANKV